MPPSVLDPACGTGVFLRVAFRWLVRKGRFDPAKALAFLVETLQGEGPFTVFAPTDEAFAKLPAGTVEDLLKPENKAKLVAILTYHVVPGKIMAADVKTMKAKTVNGQELSIKVEDGTVTVDNAGVVKTDVAAANGVIHVIDAVVLPPAPAKDPAKAKPKDHPAH